MGPRDLKIAAIITAVCLLLSFAASWSYMRGWYWTSGVFPLVLTVILVLITTIILESVGRPTRSAERSLSWTAKPPPRKQHEAEFALLFRRFEKPLSPLLWLVLIAIERLASMLRKAKRERSYEMLRLLGRAHG